MLASAALAAAVLWSVEPVTAHALGGGGVETRFTFPPWMVWASGAFVVGLSFAVVGGFLSRSGTGRRPLAAGPMPHAHPEGLTPLRLVSLGVLVLVGLNAFRPHSDSVLPQTVVWLVVWGVLPILTYTVADVWPRVSPFEALRPFARAVRGGRAPMRYPARLGAWPSVLLLLGLIGLEMADVPLAQAAAPLALLVVLYVFLSLVAMVVFGDQWLVEGEVLTRMLCWLRAAAPLTWTGLRPHWRGIADTLDRLPVRGPADVAFTVALLYGVNFDALMATPFGRSASDHLAGLGVPWPLVALLVLGYLVFLGAWSASAAAMRRAAESLASVRQTAARFAVSLLPIAVGYHLAHNLFTVIEHAPRFVLAVVDPLGFARWPEGWLTLPARLVFPASWVPWLGAAQVGLILVGHVVAVVVAHRLAFRAYPSGIQAVRSEVPLTLVMVGYTWTGLWLLSAAHGGGT